MPDRVRGFVWALKRPKVYTRHMTDRDLLSTREILPRVLTKFARLSLALVCLHDEDRAGPGRRQPVPPRESFGTEGRRVEVARHGAVDARVGVFLDYSSYLLVGER